MPADVVHAAAPQIESTFKAREVEGVFDLYFYRPIGFWLAQVFARLKMTPAGVSLLAGIFGVVAGHLYYYRDLSVNVVGMVLQVCANAFDNADGQLARLTHRESREGRIIDSVADHLVFVSVYLHLTLRTVRRLVASDLSSRVCCRDQSCIARSSRGLLSQYLSLLCNDESTDGFGFLIRIAIGLSKIDLASGSLAETSPCVVSELYPPAGNAGTTPENVAWCRRPIVSRRNS